MRRGGSVPPGRELEKHARESSAARVRDERDLDWPVPLDQKNTHGRGKKELKITPQQGDALDSARHL